MRQVDCSVFFAFPNLPTATHRVNGEDEVGVDDYLTSDRVINFNYSNSGDGWNIPGRPDQRALRVVEQPDSQLFFGCTFSIGAADCLSSTAPNTTPNETSRIEVYIGPHNSLSSQQYTVTQIENEIRRTTGHEVGHGLHISHRAANTGDTIMSSQLFMGPPATDPRSQYDSADKVQIRLHVRF